MKIGLVGVGHLGKIHLKCLRNTPFDIIGFYDPRVLGQTFQEDLNLTSFSNLDDLIDCVDCLDIVATTSAHYSIAKSAIIKGKSVFIEKPVTETIAQAEELVELAKKHNVYVQVGHVERYNPAIRSLRNIDFSPQFIEAHRLALFNPRGTDVSVVLDLMIHDLDIILNMIKSEVKSVHANGVKIVSNTPDICNARIEFENGTVANVTASRISLKNMRKIRIFQHDAYISLDFLEKEAQVIKIENCTEEDKKSDLIIHTNNGYKRIIIDSPEIMQNNAIEEELNDFYQSVAFQKPISVTIEDGLRALRLAHTIEYKINSINS